MRKRTLSRVIQDRRGEIQAHLGEVVRSPVEETLNAMLDAEAGWGKMKGARSFEVLAPFFGLCRKAV